MSIATPVKSRSKIIRAPKVEKPSYQPKRLTINLGADPEFFFSKKNVRRTVVGSELVLPSSKIDAGRNGLITIDGVQAEINPAANTCRQSFGLNLEAALNKAKELADAKGLEINLNACIKMTKAQMDKLSDGAKGFGCKPSINAYGDYKELPNPGTYLYRAAGGHIHLGKVYDSTLAGAATDNEIVKILDIVLGNTCVLLDRDKGNIERRKVYGRAGEYRVPSHGIEYRVLSNFWLKNNVLMSFVMSVARLGVSIAADPNWRKAVLNCVDEKDIIKAINTNDAKLARENFEKVMKLIKLDGEDFSISPSSSYPNHPFTEKGIITFNYLAKKGIDNVFGGKPWGKRQSQFSHFIGWETYANKIASNVRRAKTTK